MSETPIFDQLSTELFQNTGRRYENLTADGPIPLRSKAPEAVTKYVSMLPEERSSSEQARYEDAVERMPLAALMEDEGEEAVVIETYDDNSWGKKETRGVSLKKPRLEGPQTIGMILDEMSLLRTPDPVIAETINDLIDRRMKYEFVLAHPNVVIAEHKTEPIPQDVVDRQMEFYKSALGSIGEDTPHSMCTPLDHWGADEE